MLLAADGMGDPGVPLLTSGPPGSWDAGFSHGGLQNKKKPSPEFGARALTRSRGSTRSCPGKVTFPLFGPGHLVETCNGVNRFPLLASAQRAVPPRSGSCSRGVFCGACRRRLSITGLLSLLAYRPHTRPGLSIWILLAYYMPVWRPVKLSKLKTRNGKEPVLPLRVA